MHAKDHRLFYLDYPQTNVVRKSDHMIILDIRIAMFRVMSPFVINVPIRDLLVPYTKWSFQIMVGTLALQLQCL